MSTEPNDLHTASPPAASRTVLSVLDWILLVIVALTLVYAAVLLRSNITDQNAIYTKVIGQAVALQKGDTNSFIDRSSAALAFLRAKDFANIKSISMMVGFLLIFTGALYLLKVFNLSYKLNADKTPVGKVAFESTSPGLVMITLGVALMITALCVQNEVDFQAVKKGTESAALAVARAKADSLTTVFQTLEGGQKNGADLPQGIKKVAQEKPDSTFIPVAGSKTPKIKPDMKNIGALEKKLKTNSELKVHLVPQLGSMDSPGQLHQAERLLAEFKTMLVNDGVPSEQVLVKTRGEGHSVPDAALLRKRGIRFYIQ